MEQAPSASPPLKIVVAEDDPLTLLFLKETLENQFGHRVIAEATTGPDMIRTVLNQEPDLVVFDIHLPHVSGLEALRQIYQERIVAAVAITADRDQELVQKVLEEHVLAFLIKPVQAYQLGPAVLVAWTRFGELQALASENESLRQTLENRKIIERAKGLLMTRHRLTEADAFRRLQRGAMNRRVPMVELANDVLNGKDVPL
jgi:response regulator NasT